MEKMIHWELCKKTLKFLHTNKWYMHKPESVLENKIFWDFEIEMDNPILARRLNFVLIKEPVILWHFSRP